MDISEFQKKVLEAFSAMDALPNRREHTKQSALIHLVEEIGEIARQVTSEYHRPEKFDRKNLASELADTLMFIVVLADLYEIDLSSEMTASIKRVRHKIDMLTSDKTTRR